MGERRYERAIKLCKAMIEKLPDTEVVREGFVHEEIALACMALGRWEEAIEAWKGYVNRSVSSGGVISALYSIAYCYNRLEMESLKIQNYVIAKRIELADNNAIKNQFNYIFEKYPYEDKKETRYEYAVRTSVYFQNILINNNLLQLNNEKLVNDEVAKKTEEYLKKYGITLK